jgi:hypothetical protein
MFSDQNGRFVCPMHDIRPASKLTFIYKEMITAVNT